jgi:hypothetical protein
MEQLAALAARHALPAISHAVALAGGLISYGSSLGTATRSRLTWEKWRDHSLFKLNVPSRMSRPTPHRHRRTLRRIVWERVYAYQPPKSSRSEPARSSCP